MIDNAVYGLKEADIIFLGINYYETCGKKGNGPKVIRQSINLWSTYDFKKKIDIFDKLKICDIGDISGSFKDIIKKSLVLKDAKGVPIILGGEHLISYAVVNALRPKNVLVFDAHADSFDKYKGKKYSYATVVKRISEIADNVYLCGVRDVCVEEDLSNVKLIKLKDVKKIKGPVYVSIDLDVLDPIYCPDVSTPVPFGLKLDELVKVLNGICFKIIGLDVVELTSKKVGLSSTTAGGIIMSYLKRRCKIW